MNPEEQQFLEDLDKKLWTAANKLLPMLDAAVYKHVVLGLIFLKYVSDAFKERRAELEAAFRDPDHDYYLGEDGDDLIAEELEARDYYPEKNVFWVPALARWDFIQAHAKVAVGTKLKVKNGKTTEYEFKGIGRLLDDALDAVEKENPKLKGVLEKDYARKQ
ncbi:MAG: type I restriction-modification system subunit M N-terminal domain-containing protein, partial [Verrucomicrobiota bacterium]|nr:type I restriction-modification system subunit M N-terminal domain-containing protein [Verrucomicrobiota bacterium]